MFRRDAVALIALTVTLAGCRGDRAESSPTPDVAALYIRCSSCHGENGEGLPSVYPPLAGSAVVTGPVSIPIRIVMGGLEGPITVKGERFDSAMPPWGDGGAPLTDAELAALLTYIRTSWGNAASEVTAADVAKERPSVAGRIALWTAAELGIR